MRKERYLAILGPGVADQPPSPAIQRIAARLNGLGLIPTTVSADLVIYRDPEVPVIIGRCCTLLGHAYGAFETIAHNATEPSMIAEACWGNYLAFGNTQHGPIGWLLRAPMGHLPVLRHQHGEWTLLASGADLIADAAEIPVQIDWRFCAAHLACQHLVTSSTGIEGIDELLGGECFRRKPDGSWHRETVWSPWQWTRPDREVADIDEAARALRASVEQAVHCLTSEGGPYLLELSGGLDSSILAAALVAAGSDARAVTLVTEAAESDERKYARAAASTTGLALSELALGKDSDLTRLIPGRLARPGLPAILAHADRVLATHGHADRIAAFVSGAGGDCVLCSPVSAAPAADTLHRFGLGRETWHAVAALARIHHSSIWAVARMAWQQSRSGPVHARWPLAAGLLATDRIPTAAPWHPWFDEPADVLPGKRSHVRGVLASLAHIDGYGRHAVAPSRFPLLSQPVVETALRIPSWLWIAQGRDRAVARHAWRGLLPSLVLDRRIKGGLENYVFEAFTQNLVRLRPFLLEGHLTKNGVVDRGKVEGALSRTPHRLDPTPYLLLQLVDTEAWVRAWIGAP